MMTGRGTHRVCTYDAGDGRELLVVRVELRVGDLAGDIATRNPSAQTVDHQPLQQGALGLSVTHDFMRGRRDLGGGACVPSIATINNAVEWCDGWNMNRYVTLHDMAERWHLNLVRAWCAHQRGKIVYRSAERGGGYDLDATPACPHTGYQLGSAWLAEPMPDDVLAYWRDLIEGN